MLILALSYLGGVLTIFSPCVLPVVPFVFSRSDEPFRRSGLPMLVGMGLSFAFFGALSVTGGKWVIQANQYGRFFALFIFTLLGLTLLFPKLAEKFMRPFVQLGGFLQKKAEAGSGLGSSLLLGASIGLLWAPCAGPILGLVLAGAAVSGSNQKTLGLLLVFAAGAATSLAVAILAGGKLLRSLKKGLGAEEWIKRFIGVAVLGAVLAIAFGLDTKVLSQISYFSTNKLEAKLVAKFSSDDAPKENLEGQMPALDGANDWINSAPLTRESLRGKVVLIDFWTYSCINCLRTLPYVKAWSQKYKDQGLVVIGIHSPEFAFEKDIENVKKAVRDLGIDYPVAIDNDQKLWNAFKNKYWPAHYFIDTKGVIRYQHSGEGDYAESEKMIQSLLMEKNPNSAQSLTPLMTQSEPIQGQGIEAQASRIDQKSPETYLGYGQEEGFSSKPEINEDEPETYHHPKILDANHWSLEGRFVVEEEKIKLIGASGSLRYHFLARDLHLVLGTSSKKPIHFRVTLDGKAPGANHGIDIDAQGNGVITDQRLYQLIRKKDGSEVQDFEIEFLEPDAQAYAFTFG